MVLVFSSPLSAEGWLQCCEMSHDCPAVPAVHLSPSVLMQHTHTHCLLGLFLPTLTDGWAGAAERCLHAARLLLGLGIYM